jgi:two-component system OmpR family response regulator
MRVLVIEDDDAIRSVLERGLRAEGFDVESCADGQTGLWRALEGGFAVIVLDLLLPGRNGWLVCEAIRAEGDRVPILVLTAKSGEFDEIDLLDAGADDFVTKPVSINVLAARLRRLIRRTSALADNRMQRGDLVYDMGTRECQVGGRPVHLTSREHDILCQLLLAGGACRSRGELVEAVWGSNAGVDPTNLDVHLRRLRDKLAPVVVENVRGLGYRIALR